MKTSWHPQISPEFPGQTYAQKIHPRTIFQRLPTFSPQKRPKQKGPISDIWSLLVATPGEWSKLGGQHTSTLLLPVSWQRWKWRRYPGVNRVNVYVAVEEPWFLVEKMSYKWWVFRIYVNVYRRAKRKTWNKGANLVIVVFRVGFVDRVTGVIYWMLVCQFHSVFVLLTPKKARSARSAN